MLPTSKGRWLNNWPGLAAQGSDLDEQRCHRHRLQCVDSDSTQWSRFLQMVPTAPMALKFRALRE